LEGNAWDSCTDVGRIARSSSKYLMMCYNRSFKIYIPIWALLGKVLENKGKICEIFSFHDGEDDDVLLG
jgi:hypothetical protein